MLRVIHLLSNTIGGHMRDRWSFCIGLFFLCLALLTLFVWIPRDIETGIVEVFRRNRTIGDSFVPSVAASGIAITSLLLIAGSFRHDEEAQASHGKLTVENLRFALWLLAIFVISLAVMFWLGPLIVKLAGMSGMTTGTYRELRGSIPWKYAGYFGGGTLMLSSFISLIETRWRWRTLAIAAAVTILLALLYDLPFQSLLLPPNGDY